MSKSYTLIINNIAFVRIFLTFYLYDVYYIFDQYINL